MNLEISAWKHELGMIKPCPVKDNKISMLQDVEANRRTEIDTLNAEIVRLGEKHGIPTPYNQTMTSLVKAREQKMLWDMAASKS